MLINILEEIRIKDIEECKFDPDSSTSAAAVASPATSAAQGKGPKNQNSAKKQRPKDSGQPDAVDTVSERAFQRFLLCFFRVQNILFTRIGTDELERLNQRQNELLKAYLTQSADAAANKVEHVKKLIYVSMVLIFIAHATITDAQSKKKKPMSLAETFTHQLPKLALTQIAEFILVVVDRVLEAPSEWQMCLTPLLLWLTLHIDDGLLAAVFAESEHLQTELARVHELVSNHCKRSQDALEGKGLLVGEARLSLQDKQADRQLYLLDLLGNTLLFEENHLVGFLPLRSYLETRKQLGSGKKCPPGEEDLVRCLLFRDCLERLKCTRADIPDKCEPIGQTTSSGEESKGGESQAEKAAAMDTLFAQIDETDQTSEPLMQREKPLIVLDAQNVAMRHGADKLFSCRGI